MKRKEKKKKESKVKDIKRDGLRDLLPGGYYTPAKAWTYSFIRFIGIIESYLVPANKTR